MANKSKLPLWHVEGLCQNLTEHEYVLAEDWNDAVTIFQSVIKNGYYYKATKIEFICFPLTNRIDKE